MDWFSVCLDGLVIIAQGILHMNFVCQLTGKAHRAWYDAGYIFLLAIIEVVFDFYGFGGEAAVEIQLLLLYGISRLILKNSRTVSWTASALAVYIVQLCFGIINSMEAAFIPPTIHGLLLYGLLLLATLAVFAICAGCYRWVLNILSLTDTDELPHIGLLVFPGMFLLLAELYILRTAYASAPVAFSWTGIGKHLILLCLQVMGLGALFCMLYAWRGICQAHRSQAAVASLTQAVGAQKTYIAEARQRYERTRSFRHDIKNHLSVLNGLLRAGKTEEAQRYLEKMETVSSALSFSYHTGNPVVDVLLSEKLSIAQDQEIRTEISLELPVSRGMDDFDWCVLLANALDNAVAGCGAVSSGRRYIEIEGRCQGTFYFLAVENSCAECLQEPPAEGTGLAGIRTVAAKYGGTVKTMVSGGVFRLEVLLIFSQQPANLSRQMG